MWLHFLASATFLKGKALSNGQVMTQRHSWRCFCPPGSCSSWHGSMYVHFPWLVQCDFHDTKSLEATQEALDKFHHYHDIFKDVGIHEDFNLPWQHSLQHYVHLVQEYGSPNGICSLITENKHIKAVKKPWRQLSRWQAMCQIFISNQCMDKLAAPCTLFKSCGMLKGTCLSDTLYQLHEWFDFLTTVTTN